MAAKNAKYFSILMIQLILIFKCGCLKPFLNFKFPVYSSGVICDIAEIDAKLEKPL